MTATASPPSGVGGHTSGPSDDSECASGGQRFCLKWNNYQSNVTTTFKELLAVEDFVDITLSAEGGALRAHKVVLSACSPYFRDILKGISAWQHPVIVLKDVPFGDLQGIVEFIYHGEVSVDRESLASFLKTAQMLRVKGLTEEATAAANPSSSSSSSRTHLHHPRKSSRPTRAIQKRQLSMDSTTTLLQQENKRPNLEQQQDLKAEEVGEEEEGEIDDVEEEVEEEEVDDDEEEEEEIGDDEEEEEEEEMSPLQLQNPFLAQSITNAMAAAAAACSNTDIGNDEERKQRQQLLMQGGDLSVAQGALDPDIFTQSLGLPALKLLNTNQSSSLGNISGSPSSSATSSLSQKKTCPYCYQQLSWHALSRHIRDMHRAKTNFVTCKFCQKMFRNKNSLGCHMWRFHKDAKEKEQQQQGTNNGADGSKAFVEEEATKEEHKKNA